MFKKKSSFLSAALISTAILTAAGFASRIIGFFYRIFLSNTIGAEGIGFFTLIMPVFTISFSICGAAYQTTISAFIAADSKAKNDLSSLFSGLLLSLASSALISTIIYYYSKEIAVHLLHEPKCEALVRLLAFTIPLSSIHSCLNGYFYGKAKAGCAALSQLIEQLGRVFFVYIYWIYLSSMGRNADARIAVLGLIYGEAFAVLFLIIAFVIHCIKGKSIQPSKISSKALDLLSPILLMSLPLIFNRLILSVLSGAESVMIPQMLILYGMSSQKAMSYYGILNGMSMPFILFPGALTNSLAVILLPDIAKSKAEGNIEKIRSTISESISLCLCLGIGFTGIFFFYGEALGTTIFKEAAAGIYIKNLSLICPFIYLSTTLGSILNGLGKTFTTLLQSCASTVIRLFFICMVIPRYGMRAYLWGILISWITLTLLNVISLYRITHFCFDFVSSVLWPLLIFMGIYLIVEKTVQPILTCFTGNTLVTLIISVSAISLSYFYVSFYSTKCRK